MSRKVLQKSINQKYEQDNTKQNQGLDSVDFQSIVNNITDALDGNAGNSPAIGSIDGSDVIMPLDSAPLPNDVLSSVTNSAAVIVPTTGLSDLVPTTTSVSDVASIADSLTPASGVGDAVSSTADSLDGSDHSIIITIIVVLLLVLSGIGIFLLWDYFKGKKEKNKEQSKKQNKEQSKEKSKKQSKEKNKEQSKKQNKKKNKVRMPKIKNRIKR